MAILPDYLTDQTESAIRQRMLDNTPSDLDNAEGSFIYDSLSPAAIELALAAIWAQQVLQRGFASTTFGSYLDLRCEEHGLTRRAAVKATGQVKFTGTATTVVPIGTRVTTLADAATNTSSVEFVTTAAVTLNGSGIGYAAIEAVEAGVKGNVAVGAINLMVTTVSGVTAVTNETATIGGVDTEDDISLLSRYLQKVRSPSAGGNKADYVNWSLEVASVGGVSVIPVEDGPGTVNIYLIGSDKTPASQTLVDSVQNYIAPPWTNETEAETMTLGGSGTSIDTTQTDDTGDSVKMVYNVAGNGTLIHSSLQTILQQPGIWQARPRIKVDSIAGTTNLLEVGIWNVSAAAWAKISPSSATDAVQTLRATDLSLTFVDKIQDFYWNGQDQLELRITRLNTETVTTVWIDRAVYLSTFSQDTGGGKAPVGAKVGVRSAIAVTINVSATLTIASGYNADSVKAAVQQGISDYIKSLAFADNNDVLYTRIGQAILDTAGVTDYQSLTVNGGVANIVIAAKEVAVTGTVTLN